MAELALLGGSRAVMIPCPPGVLDTGAGAEAALAGIRAWLRGTAGSALSGSGPTAELERAFSRLLGRRYAVAVSSGTAGLLAALRAAGAGPGRAVLVPAYDWPAAAAAGRALGARVVPLDVELASGTIATASAAARATPEAVAVVATHLGGRPAALEPLLEWARGRGLVVIEDGAQGLGARAGGRLVGTAADLAVFSLGPNKLVSAGEGGVVATDDERLYEAVVRWTQHPLYQRLRGFAPDPLHVNFRLHPVAALLALPQLGTLAERLARMRANAAHWRRALAGRPGFVLPEVRAGDEPSWWSFALRYDDDAWGLPLALGLAALQAEGVPLAAGPVGRTICSLLRGTAEEADPCCPAAERWRATALALPCPAADPSVFAPFVEQVAAALDKVWEGRVALRRLAWTRVTSAGFHVSRSRSREEERTLVAAALPGEVPE